MFSTLRLSDFRGIKNLELTDLRRVNLLVGRNNCGKTTILEAFFLMINPCNLDLPGRTNAFRGLVKITDRFWRVLFRDQDLTREIVLDTDLDAPPEHRQLRIRPQSKPIPVAMQSAAEGPTIGTQEVGSESRETVSGIRATAQFAIVGEEQEQYEVSVGVQNGKPQLEIPEKRKEARHGRFLSPASIHAQLPERLDKLIASKQINRIINVLRLIEPQLIGLSMGSDNTIYCDVGSEWLLPWDVMGAGMKNVLSILVNIVDSRGGIVLVDEIEDGLHPASQGILWRTLFEASREFDTQLIATTHSIECVRAFHDCYSPLLHERDGIRLYRIERNEDSHRSIAYNHVLLGQTLEQGWEMR